MRRTLSMFVSAAAVVVALCGVCGCTPATNFYTLARVEGAPAPAGEAAHARLVIALGPVALPDYVERAQIVVRDGPYTIRPAAFDLWAGDLDDMLPQVLMENLAQRMAGDTVVPFPRITGPRFDYRVAVRITQFDVSSAGEAVVAAGLQVYDHTGTHTLLITDTTARSQAASASWTDRVAALSAALGNLSSDIALALAPLPRGEGGSRK